ncbi:reverse transcriptase domain-containing protein [Tanacetum coccineum]
MHTSNISKYTDFSLWIDETLEALSRYGGMPHTSGPYMIFIQHDNNVKLDESKSSSTDVTGYNQRFQELALLCVRMFPEESDKELMDKKNSTLLNVKLKNKEKHDNYHQANNNFPRGRMWSKLTPQDWERKMQTARGRHLTRDCWSSAATNNQRTLTCYECGNQGHYKSDCPKLKNQNHGNQAEGTGTLKMALALGEENRSRP